MILKEREQDILFKTIQSYIESGIPVSSGMLYDAYDFGLKPASIRAELHDLEGAGYLSQMHTSGGRIPTDRALELFAESIQEQIKHEDVFSRVFGELVNAFFKEELETFLDDFAVSGQVLSIGFKSNNKETYTKGLDVLFDSLDTNEPQVFKDIAKDFETLDERIEECMHALKHTLEPLVFIGKKSPLMKNEHLVTMIDTFEAPGGRVLLGAVGPRRMDYKKNLKAFMAIRKELEQ